MDIFTVLFYQPIFNLLIVLYRLFSENLGLAIIAIALISRLITLPITMRQMKMATTSKEMQTKMDVIKKKYKSKDDRKEEQQKELMKVQSEYLPSQLAGCLPAILQLILFINVYNVINNIIAKGIESFNAVAYNFVPQFDASYIVHTSFLGIDLKSSAAHFGFTDTQVIPYLLIVVLVAVTQFFSMKYMTGGGFGQQNKDKVVEDNKSKKGKKSKDEKKPDDFGSIIQQSTKQTAFLFPMMIALISYNVASGLGFYWIAQSSFVIIQQFITKQFKKRKLKRDMI